MFEVKVPILPESVTSATISTWHKSVGDLVKREEILLDLETDKVVLEIPSPIDGILEKTFFKLGDTVTNNQLLAIINDNKEKINKYSLTEIIEENNIKKDEKLYYSKAEKKLSPSIRRMLCIKNIDSNNIIGSGKRGRILKKDLTSFFNDNTDNINENLYAQEVKENQNSNIRTEKIIPMTRLRMRIAERLIDAQHNAAILTTFNEVKLDAVLKLRTQYQEKFLKKYEVKLGLMSFFTKAVIESLKSFPIMNASIIKNNIVYHEYYDIGIAVSTDRGLVVPILRNAENMSIPDIEKKIKDFSIRARKNLLKIEEIQGGTFTITNGGVFGSLLSTPIINPPQTGILGINKIEERPIVENGKIVICSMMYIALSYDHRLIDGKESIQFLITIKEFIEDPIRLLLTI